MLSGEKPSGAMEKAREMVNVVHNDTRTTLKNPIFYRINHHTELSCYNY